MEMCKSVQTSMFIAKAYKQNRLQNLLPGWKRLHWLRTWRASWRPHYDIWLTNIDITGAVESIKMSQSGGIAFPVQHLCSPSKVRPLCRKLWILQRKSTFAKIRKARVEGAEAFQLVRRSIQVMGNSYKHLHRKWSLVWQRSTLSTSLSNRGIHFQNKHCKGSERWEPSLLGPKSASEVVPALALVFSLDDVDISEEELCSPGDRDYRHAAPDKYPSTEQQQLLHPLQTDFTALCCECEEPAAWQCKRLKSNSDMWKRKRDTVAARLQSTTHTDY